MYTLCLSDRLSVWPPKLSDGFQWCLVLESPLRIVERVRLGCCIVVTDPYFAWNPNLTTWWTKVLPDKLIVTQLIKKFPACYSTRRLNIVFIRAGHWSLPWARWIRSTCSHPFSLRSILMLSFHLLPGLLSGLFSPGFLSKLYTHLSFLPCVLQALPSSPSR